MDDKVWVILFTLSLEMVNLIRSHEFWRKNLIFLWHINWITNENGRIFKGFFVIVRDSSKLPTMSKFLSFMNRELHFKPWCKIQVFIVISEEYITVELHYLQLLLENLGINLNEYMIIVQLKGHCRLLHFRENWLLIS